MATYATSHAPALQSLDDLARRRERDQLDRHAETPCQLARKIDGDAARLAGRGVFGREDRIAEIDRGAQRARGREIGDDSLAGPWSWLRLRTRRALPRRAASRKIESHAGRERPPRRPPSSTRYASGATFTHLVRRRQPRSDFHRAGHRKGFIRP